jgi:YidC/Oxa1 family membrane protein insertase
MPRWLITIILVLAAGLLTWAMINSSTRRPKAEPPPTTAPAPTERDAEPEARPDAPPVLTEDQVPPVPGLKVRAVTERQDEPVLGSASNDAANPYSLEARLTPWGGGLVLVRLATYSVDVAPRGQGFEPYTVQEPLTRTVSGGQKVTVYPMAAESVTVNGQRLMLDNQRWQVTWKEGEDQATIELTLEDEAGKDVLRISRRWVLSPRGANEKEGGYGLRLEQRVQNLYDRPLRVVFSQYGPGDLPAERGYIGDQRHVTLGYLRPYRAGDVSYISTDDYHLSRGALLEEGARRLWPGEGQDDKLDLLWAALTNRYFAAALHAPVDPAAPRARSLETKFPDLQTVIWGGANPQDQSLAIRLTSRAMDLPPEQSASLDVDLFAGPKLPDLLTQTPQYQAIGLSQMIVYNLGGCCAVCTFAWLANGLLAFLSFCHWLVRDWGVAIILLVALVRTVLHPLTKSSQVNMMKLSKQMAALQPEMEKIKAKYPDNAQKQSQEIWALQKEKGINPASMGLGCLPMFLQMPIWIALYAMLYFAIELRHQPALWGVFQWISGGHWQFLADLSSQDRFIPLPPSMHFGVPWIGQTLDAINILPILMGVVFYIQQKYMTPPNPNMSPEMRQQQVMMKWMTVILFPVMLFWAPSGLTLYILTSTFVGIVESKRVRQHVKELEESGRLHEKKPPKPGGWRDRFGKMLEARRKLMEEQLRLQQEAARKKKKKGDR